MTARAVRGAEPVQRVHAMAAITDPSSMAVDIWPTRVLLNRSQQRQVADYLRKHGSRCPSCGGLTPEVDVPGAMAAFHADADRYDVVVKCAAAACDCALWSVRLPARRFLRVRATSWRPAAGTLAHSLRDGGVSDRGQAGMPENGSTLQ